MFAIGSGRTPLLSQPSCVWRCAPRWRFTAPDAVMTTKVSEMRKRKALAMRIPFTAAARSRKNVLSQIWPRGVLSRSDSGTSPAEGIEPVGGDRTSLQPTTSQLSAYSGALRLANSSIIGAAFATSSATAIKYRRAASSTIGAAASTTGCCEHQYVPPAEGAICTMAPS